MVLMGGDFPQSVEEGEYNLAWGGVGRDSQFVIENWPTRILFCGWTLGDRVRTGQVLATTSASNPVRRAYELYLSPNVTSRSSWDLMTVLAAVRGVDPLWEVSSDGYCEVAPSGANRWLALPDRGHAYLIEKAAPDEVERVLNGILALPPGC